ncbi:unnamed protein product [Discosporangium mesarthrocarpum]
MMRLQTSFWLDTDTNMHVQEEVDYPCSLLSSANTASSSCFLLIVYPGRPVYSSQRCFGVVNMVKDTLDELDASGALVRKPSTFRNRVGPKEAVYTPGEFRRSSSEFRDRISSDHPVYKAEAGRYHLYVNYACPWSQRALIAWATKGLQGVVGMTTTHPTWQKTRPEDPTDTHFGWTFASADDPPFIPATGHGAIPCDGCEPDPLHGFKYIRDVYQKAGGEGLTKFTVPILYDKKTDTVVNNESSEIIEIFDTAFNEVEGVINPDLDLNPPDLVGARKEIDEWSYTEIGNGVYRSGFARSQGAYEVAVSSLFEHLDRLEEILATRRYVAGDRVTLSDVRLFPTLVRFDEVYNVYFKCNVRRIIDYPNILNYVRDIYQNWPGFRETTNMDHIKRHYYTSHPSLNMFSIIPKGPNFLSTLKEPHDRDRFS